VIAASATDIGKVEFIAPVLSTLFVGRHSSMINDARTPARTSFDSDFREQSFIFNHRGVFPVPTGEAI
jgi:hypothetical protein